MPLQQDLTPDQLAMPSMVELLPSFRNIRATNKHVSKPEHHVYAGLSAAPICFRVSVLLV